MTKPTIRLHAAETRTKWSVNATFLIGALIASLTVLLSLLLDDHEAIIVTIVGLVILVASGIFSVRFELTHPFFWFGSVFLLYSISAPLLYVIQRYKYYDSYHSALLLEYVAILVFMLVLGTRGMKVNLSRHVKNIAKLKFGGQVVFLASLVGIVVFLWFMMSIGLVSKMERIAYENPLFKLDFLFTFANVGLSIIFSYSLLHVHKVPHAHIMIYVALLVLSLLIIGERDVFFRFVVTALIIYSAYARNLSIKTLILGGLVLGVLSTLMGFYKGFFLEGSLRSVGIVTYLGEEFGLRDVIALLLGSEFRTASENLSRLLQVVPRDEEFFHGRGFLLELKSVMNLGFLTGRDSVQNLSNWFASTYYPNFYKQGGGVGFSLVGQGYVDFGLFGVVVLFLGLGFVTRVIYVWSSTSVVGMLFYVNFIPIMLIAIRQTTALIISQPLKHVLLPIFVAVVIGHIVRYSKSRQEPGDYACTD